MSRKTNETLQNDSAIAVEAHPDGCLLSVRVQPGAKRAGIVGCHAGAMKIAVTAPAEKGRANRAVIEVIHAELRVKRSAIQLVTGPTARNKRFLLRGVSAPELCARLGASTG